MDYSTESNFIKQLMNKSLKTLVIRKKGLNAFFKTVFLICILSKTIIINSQTNQFRFRHIDRNNGLSNNRVQCIYKDRNGFMWFGTLEGLNRYDGNSVKIFQYDNSDSSSLNDNFIRDITEDHLGRLWFRDNHGFSIYNSTTESFSKISPEILQSIELPGNDSIANIFHDNLGNFWYISSNNCIYKYQAETNKIITIVPNPEDSITISSANISGVVSDNYRYIWIVQKNGRIEKLSNNTNNVEYRNDYLINQLRKNNLNVKLYIDHNDNLWIAPKGIAAGLFCLKIKENEFIHFHDNNPGYKLNKNMVTGVVEGYDNNVWISTDHGGINIINSDAYSTRYITSDPEDKYNLSQNAVTSLFRDNSGFIWAGTNKNGINCYHPNIFKFKLFKNKTLDPGSLPFSDVVCFAEDKENNIWIGTNGGGLIYYNRKTATYKQYLHNPNNPNSISSDIVVNLWIDNKENLWIALFNGGLNCYNGKYFKKYLPNWSDTTSLHGINVWALFEDSQNRFWVSTLSNGIRLFDKESGTFNKFHDQSGKTIDANQVNQIMEDSRGNIWFATYSGIYILNKKPNQIEHLVRNIKHHRTLISNNIHSILEDNNGNIWVATRKGLNMFDKRTKSVRLFTKKDGLPDNFLVTMLKDDFGNLWIGTPNGLCNLALKHESVDDSLRLTFTNYSQADGLQEGEFNQFSAFKTNAGELIFGGTGGYNIIEPGKIISDTEIPEIRFTAFYLFNKEVKVGEVINNRIILQNSITCTNKIELKHKENMFSIEFAALNFSHPEKCKYKYKLDGFSSEWIYLKDNQRSATFTNLNPGEYYFKVKASNSEGVWNRRGISLKIVIRPPWWKSTWFKVSVGIVILLTIAIFYFIRIIILSKQKKILEKTVKIRTKELNIAVSELEKKQDELVQANILLKENQEEIVSQNAELTNHRENLEKLVNERTAELEEVREKAEDADKLKSAFIANLSHELRTPMNAIVGFSSLLKFPDINDQEREEYITMINNNCDMLLVLINDILEISLIEVNQITIKRSLFAVDTILDELKRFFSLKNNNKLELKIEKQGINKLLHLDNDPVRFRQVFSNLLNNACKYTNKGSITFGYKLMNYKIRFFVKDTGIGIAKQDYKHIFDYFHKIEPENNSKLFRGAGIGLSICRKLVEFMGGEIWVESEINKGSTFYFTLPSSDAVNVPDIGKTTTKIMASKNEEITIAIAEDEPANFLLIKKIIEQLGCSVFWAKNGKELIEYITSLTDDSKLLILMDIKMPVINGIEAFQHIRKTRKHVPVIAVTAYALESEKSEILQYEFDDYIAKPLKPNELLNKIKKILKVH